MKAFIQKSFLLIALLMFAGSSVYAAEEDNMSITEAFNYNNVPMEITDTDSQLTLTDMENNLEFVKITAGLYAFSLIIITILIYIKQNDCCAKDIVTIIGLVTVIFGTILLVLVVGDSQQLTAPMGILGAIAGYLFGTAQKKEIPEGGSKKQQGES